MKLKKYFTLILVVFTFSFLQNVKSIYLLFNKYSYKCYHEEFFKNTVVSLRYSTLEDIHDEKEHDHSPIFNIHLYKGDSERGIDSAQAINPSGRVNFLISDNASYRVCVVPNPDSIVFKHRNTFKLSLSFTSTEDELFEKDLSEVPKNKDFDKINKKIEKVHKKVIDIMKTQQYQIFKEDEFSNRNLKNSSIIVYFTIIQIIILIILTIWQIASFKNVFKDKLNL